MTREAFPWPAWPEFQADKSTLSQYHEDEDFQQIKKQIIAEYGEQNIQTSWLKVNEELVRITDEIKQKGQHIIPILDMTDLAMEEGKAGVNEETLKEIRKTGCFIVRNVIDQCQVETMHSQLQDYASINKGRYNAWPETSPSILSLYSTPVQNELRIHPNMRRLMRWINELWNSYSDDIDAQVTSPEPLIYADGVRMRPPGQPFLGLGPHIDAGSLCRWADPAYRSVYGAIFSGSPEMHDAYNISRRSKANQALYSGAAHSTVMRSFQGWTAMSRTAPRQGTILLYPNVITVMAYLLLRPFFKPPDDPEKLMDASKWSFDPDECWFPGTFKPDSQLLSPTSHPHLHLKQCLVHAPPLNPGDTIWWHTDVSYAYVYLQNDITLKC